MTQAGRDDVGCGGLNAVGAQRPGDLHRGPGRCSRGADEQVGCLLTAQVRKEKDDASHEARSAANQGRSQRHDGRGTRGSEA